MRIINKIVGSHRRVEIQGMKSGTEVMIHLWDGMKLLVEQSSLADELSLSVDWGDAGRPIPVYDGQGNEVAILSRPEEGDLNVE